MRCYNWYDVYYLRIDGTEICERRLAHDEEDAKERATRFHATQSNFDKVLRVEFVTSEEHK